MLLPGHLHILLCSIWLDATDGSVEVLAATAEIVQCVHTGPAGAAQELIGLPASILC